MKPHPKLTEIHTLTRTAAAALTALIDGKGRDGHGQRLPDIETNVAAALRGLVEAGTLAAELLKREAR